MDEANLLILNNVEKIMQLKKISKEEMIQKLGKSIPKKEVEDFFNKKKECSDQIIYGLSKVLKINNTCLFQEYNRKYKLKDFVKEEKLLILFDLLKHKEKYDENNINEIIIKLTKIALKKDLVSISYASYLLDKDFKSVLEMENE